MTQSMIPSAIQLHHVHKTYQLYEHPLDRLKEALTGRTYHSEINALAKMDLEIPKGQVVGLIGNNGAGKSTFLKLVTGTIQPSAGEIYTQGRIAAILELGSGFHPDMSGRENVFLSGMVMGMSKDEVANHYDEIVAFSGIGDFIDRPVKTYSSGMMMRLAFAVATSGEPDILVIDEALSVGDGLFARKSFDRIIQFRDAGKTILFCSHSLYQVEAICDRAIWLHQGQIHMQGETAEVVARYNAFLSGGVIGTSQQNIEAESVIKHEGNVIPKTAETVKKQSLSNNPKTQETEPTIRLVAVDLAVDNLDFEQTPRKHCLPLETGQSDLYIRIKVYADATLPAPTVAIAFTNEAGMIISSMGTQNDSLQLQRDTDGFATVVVHIPQIPLLKGRYGVDVYVMCEHGVHLYEQAIGVSELQVSQQGLEQGIFTMQRHWDTTVKADSSADKGVLK